MFAGKHILVAGATGFLGSSIAKSLLAQGAKVRGTHFSRSPSYSHDNLTWLHADLEDSAACAAACAGVDMVFMCAANTAGAKVMATTPLVQVTPNVVMNARMMEAAHRAAVKKYVFISSGAAYPDLGEDYRLEEKDMQVGNPPDVYFAVGWMKRYAEILCRTYATKIKNPMPCLVIRPSNVYGPGDKFDLEKSHVTAAQIRKVVDRHDPIVVWGDGSDSRDLIYIDDFLRGVFLACAKDDPYFEVNIASGTAVSVNDILQAAMVADNYTQAKVTHDISKPRTIGARQFSTDLAAQTLGFRTEIDLAEGVKRTIQWLKATPGVLK